jgi:hypothetical protein
MIEHLYFAVRLWVVLLAIPVVALILNAFIFREKTEKGKLAKKVAKPMLIFVLGLLGPGVVFLAHEAGILFEGEILYPAHWTKIVFQGFFAYSLLSCVDAFTPPEDKSLWNAGVIIIGLVCVSVFAILEVWS